VATSKLIVNRTRGNVVCERATLADGPLLRFRGLMLRRELQSTAGMLLVPSPSVHTCFMRFALDLLFLDADLRVMKAVDQLRPWRIAGKRGARSVLELAAGERARRGVEVGDQLELLDDPFDHSDVDLASSGEGDEPVLSIEPTTGQPDSSGAMRVLLITGDRRFCHTAALLLARRGCTVTIGEESDDVGELVARHDAEVVVLDAGRSLTAAACAVATMETLTPPVGVVIVGNEAQRSIVNLPVLDRWGSFDALFTSVMEAHRNRALRKSLVERG
jgi:uncharacterized membrane protein (UPF0127 family)